MKIGIMTFWWSNDKYGQLLQCYALQKYLTDLGHKTFLIRYYPDTDIPYQSTKTIKKICKVFNPKKLYIFIKDRIKRIKIEKERKYNNRQFEIFRQKYIVQTPILYYSLKELQDNPPQADIYIVGSDQVWNYYCKFSNTLRAYFLDFGAEKSKRMSYAASWGRTAISDDEIHKITPLLKRFDYVSVREINGIELCKKCGFHSAEWVCDPTLLLSAAAYRILYNDNTIRKIEKKYLLLYLLGNECDFNTKNVYNFAKKKKLEVIFVTGNDLTDRHKKFFATIPEWLYLIDNAEYVITNSFHCGVFSTIFHKQFGIVPLTGKDAGMNIRFSSLFQIREIEERFITNNDFGILEKRYTPKEIKSSFLVR